MLNITIDTREQTPFSFPPELVHVKVATIKTGDYCITGDKGFAVERKSLDDFLGTISSGWERFKREIFRAKDAGFSLPIVVEGNLEYIVFHFQEVAKYILIKAVLDNVDKKDVSAEDKIKALHDIANKKHTNIVSPCHDHTNLSPAFVLKRIGEIEHLGGHVMFCGSAAMGVCYTLLKERYKTLNGGEDDE